LYIYFISFNVLPSFLLQQPNDVATQQGKPSSTAKSSNQPPTKKLPHIFNAMYKRGEKLGEGGYAVVYQATSVTEKKKYAVKIVTRANLTPADELSLRQEVGFLQELNNPNIVKAFDLFEEKDFFYVILELVVGGELFDRIVEKTYYNEKEARDLVVILLNAISYMHGKNIIHRYLMGKMINK
jgi:calcium/calmodulin-dependent protein kinase I